MSHLSESKLLQEILEPYPVITRIPVQWAQMDANQHVNNVVYLQWVEAGRVDYFEQIGMMSANINEFMVGPILASAECKYIFPITYPDTVLVGTRCQKIEGDRFTLDTVIASETHERLAAINTAVVVNFDYASRKKVAISESLREKILNLEM